MIQYFKDDVSRPVTIEGNKKLSLPRYYRDKIFTDSEKALRTYKLSKYAEKHEEKHLDPLYRQRLEHINLQEEKKLQKTN